MMSSVRSDRIRALCRISIPPKKQEAFSRQDWHRKGLALYFTYREAESFTFRTAVDGVDGGSFRSQKRPRRVHRACHNGTQEALPHLQGTPTLAATCTSNIPGSVQYVDPPRATSSEAHRVHGGNPSELNVLDGHFVPERRCDKEGVDCGLFDTKRSR